jgi:hypothetical protein
MRPTATSTVRRWRKANQSGSKMTARAGLAQPQELLRLPQETPSSFTPTFMCAGCQVQFARRCPCRQLDTRHTQHTRRRRYPNGSELVGKDECPQFGSDRNREFAMLGSTRRHRPQFARDQLVPLMIIRQTQEHRGRHQLLAHHHDGLSYASTTRLLALPNCSR